MLPKTTSVTIRGDLEQRAPLAGVSVRQPCPGRRRRPLPRLRAHEHMAGPHPRRGTTRRRKQLNDALLKRGVVATRRQRGRDA